MTSKTQTIKSQQNGFNLFSIATVIMMLFYILPQAVIFVRNDVMAIIVTVYYALFVSRYVSPAIVLKTMFLAAPCLTFDAMSITSTLSGYLASHSFNFVSV